MVKAHHAKQQKDTITVLTAGWNVIFNYIYTQFVIGDRHHVCLNISGFHFEILLAPCVFDHLWEFIGCSPITTIIGHYSIICIRKKSDIELLLLWLLSWSLIPLQPLIMAWAKLFVTWVGLMVSCVRAYSIKTADIRRKQSTCCANMTRWPGCKDIF